MAGFSVFIVVLGAVAGVAWSQGLWFAFQNPFGLAPNSGQSYSTGTGNSGSQSYYSIPASPSGTTQQSQSTSASSATTTRASPTIARPQNASATTTTPLVFSTLANGSFDLNQRVDDYGSTLEECASVPKALREENGCPLDLPIDLSPPIVEGDGDTLGMFADKNGKDLKQNMQLWEGDVRVKHVAGANFTRPRTAAKDPSLKWPNVVVPFVIDPSYTPDEVAAIKRDMCTFYSVSCVRFIARTTEPDFIKIKPDKGCNCYIGRQGGKQLMSLEKPGCLSPGIPAHEMMHGIGFQHEQSRLDRDNFVNVDFSNIEKGVEFNFEKYEPSAFEDFGEAYDTFSIMHYESFSFNLNPGQPTITRRDGSLIPDPTIFSAADIRRINNLYSCSGSARPDDSQFDMTCSNPDLGIDNGAPDGS